MDVGWDLIEGRLCKMSEKWQQFVDKTWIPGLTTWIIKVITSKKRRDISFGRGSLGWNFTLKTNQYKNFRPLRTAPGAKNEELWWTVNTRPLAFTVYLKYFMTSIAGRRRSGAMEFEVWRCRLPATRCFAWKKVRLSSGARGLNGI